MYPGPPHTGEDSLGVTSQGLLESIGNMLRAPHKKRMNAFRCRLEKAHPWNDVLDGSTHRRHLANIIKHPCAAAMRLYTKLL